MSVDVLVVHHMMGGGRSDKSHTRSHKMWYTRRVPVLTT
jgi:hypothetical protein